MTMRSAGFWIFIVIILLVVGGMILLANIDLDPPQSHVEKVLPDGPSVS